MVTNSLLERDARPKKRTRTDAAPEKNATEQRPRLFAPFRALGLVTNQIPFVLQAHSFKGATEGPRIQILTCLGRSWAMWEGGKMTLLFVGPDCEQPISCLAMSGSAVWASSGRNIIKYIRGKEVGRLTSPLGSQISFILPFGDQMISLTEDGSSLLIWDCSSMEISGSIQFENGFTATIVLHPATYLNKILVGSSQGTVQLWNIRTQTCIHKFEASRLRDNADANTPCAITALTQSPAIDVVAIGFSSGEISLYDIRADERLMRIYMDESPIRGLSFRSDGQSVLASASSNGHVTLWDLNNNGRLFHVIRGAHDRAVAAIEWVPGQPVLVSSGEDNSVKQWFFESPSAAPQLLKFRSGHHEPPHLIRYYGDDGKQLLTASRDRSLRCTSVVRDSRSFELSQGSLTKKATALSTPVVNLKLPPITQLNFSTTRSKDWDDVLTAHKQESVARTWSVRDKKLGKWVFNLNEANAGKGKKKTSVGSVRVVCVSACGNFGIVGTSTGAIQMYNMQSGIRRKSYTIGPPPSEVASRLHMSSNERSVNGLASDSLNKLLVASTSDGTINFFDFHTEALLHTLVLPSTCSSILLQRDSGMLAVICDDLVIRLVDIETRRIVREFSGFTGNILDMTFSPDSRWLITTSMDSVIRTFDIPTGRLIDAFRTSSLATSVSFSPTSDFLATAHVDSVGVYLWANRAQYTDVSLHGVVDVDTAEVALPSIQGTAEMEALDALEALTVEEQPYVYSTPSQIGGDLITLTLLPRSRWQTLLNLEVIQQRNKPKEPPKAPEKAPFFLPTLPGVEHRFTVTQQKNDDDSQGRSKKSSKRLEIGASQADSVFYRKLVSEDPEGSYEDFFVYLKTLTPAGLDLELRSFGASLEGLRTLAGALRQRLRSHRDFDAVQAVMGALLMMHGEVFVANPELCDVLESLREAQTQESRRMMEVISSSLGTLSFTRTRDLNQLRNCELAALNHLSSRPTLCPQQKADPYIPPIPFVMTSPPFSNLSLSTVSDESMVEIKKDEAPLVQSATSEADEHEKYRLLYSKSRVYVHPTAYARDNIPGFVTLVKREAINPIYLLAWIPESLLNERGKEEWDKFVRIEEKPGVDDGDDDIVLIDLPVRRPETYAFSVPLTSVYSLIVHPPTLTTWHGSIAINLISGSTLPTLYFHDEESRSFSTSPIAPPINQTASGSSTTSSSYPPRILDSGSRAPGLTTTWGGEDLLARLRQYAHILRSNLQSTLFLVDPSKADVDAHTMQLFDDDAVDDILARSSYANSYSPVPAHRRPRPLSTGNGASASMSANGNSNPYSERSSVLHRSLHSPSSPQSPSQARTALLQSFANLTRATRHAAQQILSHPLAQPIVPHLPDPVRSLVNASGETQWGSWVEKGGMGEFDSARVYLARWARIVAEEGERARQREARSLPIGTGTSTPTDSRVDEDGELGVFELLHTSVNLPKPRSTRDPRHPIDEETWLGWFQADGRPRVRKEEMRKEVFRRGITPKGNLRKRIWPFILGVLDWDTTDAERSRQWEEKQANYQKIKEEWCGVDEVFNRSDVIEERHRIDVDCRRTDRTQPLFITHSPNASPSSSSSSGDDSEDNRDSRRTSTFSPTPNNHGAQAPSNDHIERLAGILLTYNFYEKDLGYVQGMSDLCAPIYVVMAGDEEMIFWCFVEVMNRMKTNFLRDQSGMKKQLITLQQLISVMDPELYRHLEKTDGLNLFFCFRWVLIAFKREFPFDDVLRLWEVLWTNYYSTNFVLFVALAILESHRDVILRYLVEFDEILKYCNDLSMTIELDTTLAQAEVLFVSFSQLVADIDRRRAENDLIVESDPTALRNRRRKNTSISVAGEDNVKSGDKEALAEGATSARSTTILLPSIGADLRELLQSGQ